MNQRAKPYVVWKIRSNLRYNIYFNGFIFCEFLNFAIVLLQFLVTNQFLSRRFLLYGLEVIRVENFKNKILCQFWYFWKLFQLDYDYIKKGHSVNALCSGLQFTYVLIFLWCYQCVAQILLLLGLAILPPTLRGTASSFCQESHVHHFPTDRFVLVFHISSLWITT